jgi:hypothetical protein
VELHTVPDPAREDLGDFRAVGTLVRAALHPAALVHDAAVDDAVADRLANDVLRVLLAVEVELDADVPERDARVREREPADPRLDHVLPEACDERVRLVRLELRRVRRQCGLELRERACPDRCTLRQSLATSDEDRCPDLARSQSTRSAPSAEPGAGTPHGRECRP